MQVFEDCTYAMNDKIQEQMRSGRNPFMFQHVEYVKRVSARCAPQGHGAPLTSPSQAAVDDSEPCVFFACPGMMQRGASREVCPPARRLRALGARLTGCSAL